MKKALLMLVAILAVVGTLALWSARQPRRTPSGQPPLESLRPANLSDFQRAFNGSRSSVRMVLLFSPTCPVCLRGASATGSLLEKLHDPKLHVLVVWEPILPTDWERPTNGALARIHDPNVVQFWDHNHLVARAISRELGSDRTGPKPRCCRLRGNLWDLAALYPAGSVWQAAAPEAVFADGPVVYVQPNVDRDLIHLLSPQN
ncbi:MAG: hypothetical protein ACRD2G_03875 [Terriglobia bacterium]